MSIAGREQGGRVSKVVGDYELLTRLGKGGMGSVFKARQMSTGRILAFKALPPSYAERPDLVARFQREVRILLGLKHENIVEGIDAGRVGNLHYLAMEYVEGEPASDVLAREGRFDEARTIGIMLTTARALAYAHCQGLIHRDVKPSNLLIGRDGVVKLCDLGLARQQSDLDFTMLGTALGTPRYMSPEQVAGVKTIDGRADVYSLGATAYHMVSGHPPYEELSGADLMAAQLTGRMKPVREVAPDVNPHLAAVIEHCIEKEPDRRYQTMNDLVEDFRLLASGGPPVKAGGDGPTHGVGPQSGDNAPGPTHGVGPQSGDNAPGPTHGVARKPGASAGPQSGARLSPDQSRTPTRPDNAPGPPAQMAPARSRSDAEAAPRRDGRNCGDTTRGRVAAGRRRGIPAGAAARNRRVPTISSSGASLWIALFVVASLAALTWAFLWGPLRHLISAS